MNFLDALIILPLCYAAYRGFKHGLIIEVFTLMALVLGLYAGIHFSDLVSDFMKRSFGWHSKWLPVLSFTFVFLAVGAMVYFAGKALERVVRVASLSPVNKFLGVFFAVLKMLYIVSIVIVLIESYDERGDFFPEEKKKESLLYYPVKKVSTTTVHGVASSTIFLKNALKPEADSTGLTVEQIIRAKEVADSLGIDANDAKEIKRIHDEYIEKDK
jgi:membrane protein required for colicin V production